MAAENDPVMAEVMTMLEAEPAIAVAPGPDIPALCEQLEILVSIGKCNEEIGMNLTHDQVRRFEDKDVIRYCKRHEAYVGSKTTENLMERFLWFSTKALGLFVRLKDVDALQNELKNDYIITKELSTLSGELALKFGRLLAGINTLLITVLKNVDFSANEDTHKHLSRDADATLTGLATGIGWISKKVVKETFTADPSSNVMNYAKFTAVMAGSITLKNYLPDQKILPDYAVCLPYLRAFLLHGSEDMREIQIPRLLLCI